MRVFLINLLCLNLLFSLEFINPKGNSGKINAVASNGNSVVLVGESGKILLGSSSSSDVSVVSSIDENVNFSDIVYENNKYTALGTSIVGYKHNFHVYNSPNGSNWSIDYSTSEDYYADMLVFGNNKYVAIGDLYGIESEDKASVLVSSDAVTWTQSNIPLVKNSVLTGLTFGDGKFVVSGYVYESGSYNTFIITSSDGTNWNYAINDVNGSFNSVYYDGIKFIAIGSQVINNQKKAMIYASSDSVTWGEVTIEGSTLNNQNLQKIVYFDGKYYLSGTKTANYFESSDLSTWTNSSNTVLTSYNTIITDFEEVNSNLYIVEGSSTYIFDGSTYSSSITSSTSSPFDNIVSFKNSLYIFGNSYNDKIIYKSDDNGTTWNTIEHNLGIQANYVKANDEVIVILNQQKQYAYSSDGINWQSGTIASTAELPITNTYDMTYGKGVFIARGRSFAYVNGVSDETNYIVTSTNGKDWEVSKSDYSIDQFHYANDIFYLRDSTETNINLYTSLDAKTWELKDNYIKAGSSYYLTDISFIVDNLETAIALGSSSTVLKIEDECIKNYSLTGNEIYNSFRTYAKYKDAYIVIGSSNTFYYTTDFISWYKLYFSVDNLITTISKIYQAGDSLIIIGTNGAIIKASDDDLKLDSKTALVSNSGECLETETSLKNKESTINLTLVDDWNFTSIPIDTDLSSTQIDSKFTNASIIWKYDNTWKAYSSNPTTKTIIESKNISFDTIKKGEGVWIKNSSKESIPFTGKSYKVTTLQEFKDATTSGWHLFGNGGETSLSTYEITTANNYVHTIWMYINSSKEWAAVSTDNSTNSALNSANIPILYNILANNAFWIYIE